MLPFPCRRLSHCLPPPPPSRDPCCLPAQPGQVNTIRMTSTSFYNGYSTMNFEWDRPRDAINGQGDSCIKGYEVGIYRVSSQRNRRTTQTTQQQQAVPAAAPAVASANLLTTYADACWHVEQGASYINCCLHTCVHPLTHGVPHVLRMLFTLAPPPHRWTACASSLPMWM